jgi:hypothetical protein
MIIQSTGWDRVMDTSKAVRRISWRMSDCREGE